MLQFFQGLDDRSEGRLAQCRQLLDAGSTALEKLAHAGLDMLGANQCERRERLMPQQRIFHGCLVPWEDPVAMELRPHVPMYHEGRNALLEVLGDMSDQYDLVVIGGGSGGLAAAKRAAEYGARVALVESGRLGGACVNVGCVPKKVMWNAADLAAGLHDAPEYGFRVTRDGHDWPLMKEKRDAYVLRLNGIHESLLAKYKVELVRGHGRLLDAHTVQAADRTLHAKHILVATGSQPLVPAISGAELGITSDGFFELEDRPQRVAVVGSGYIAIEVAGILAALGSKTTLVLQDESCLKEFDAMIGQCTLKNLSGRRR